MIYDNKLHKKTKNFSSKFVPTVGIFSQNFLPVVEFLNTNSSGPEDMPGGEWLLTLVKMIPALDSVFLKLFFPGRYPIQLA